LLLLKIKKTNKRTKSKCCDNDAKTKIEAKSLIIALECFEFFLGMIIWYDILFVINMVKKKLQYKTMCIDATAKQIENMLLYFKGFTKSTDFAKSNESK
jgi:hypothetical protein